MMLSLINISGELIARKRNLFLLESHVYAEIKKQTHTFFLNADLQVSASHSFLGRKYPSGSHRSASGAVFWEEDILQGTTDQLVGQYGFNHSSSCTKDQNDLKLQTLLWFGCEGFPERLPCSRLGHQLVELWRGHWTMRCLT